MSGTDSRGAATPERLLTVGEARQILRISEAGFYRLLRRRELGTVKVGARRLVEPAAVRAFIEARRRVGTEARHERDPAGEPGLEVPAGGGGGDDEG